MAAQRHLNISNFGDDFGKLFYLKKVPSLLFESDERPQMAVTRLKLPNGLPEPTAPVRPERGFTINVHLQQPVCRGWGTWVDGKFLPIRFCERGAVGIYDLEASPIAGGTTAKSTGGMWIPNNRFMRAAGSGCRSGGFITGRLSTNSNARE